MARRVRVGERPGAMRTSAPLLATAAATVLALPLAQTGAEAEAATITVPPCANGGTAPAVTGAGFTPGSIVTVKAGPAAAVTVAADGAGAFTARVPTTPVVFAAPREDAVTATGPEVDRARRPLVQAVAAMRVVKPEPGLAFGVRRPSLPARVNGLGYPVGKTVYAHLRFRGRTIKTARVGVASAPCGAVRGRVRGLFRVPGKRGGFPGNDRRYSVRIAAARRLTSATRPTGVIPLEFRTQLSTGLPQVVVATSSWLEGGS